VVRTPAAPAAAARSWIEPYDAPASNRVRNTAIAMAPLMCVVDSNRADAIPRSAGSASPTHSRVSPT
jgi:hypothetical protein